MQSSQGLLVLLLALGLTSCASERQLMPTPNLYAAAQQSPFETLDPTLQTALVDLLYVTDRVPVDDGSSSLPYGSARSSSVAFGSALVEIGPDTDWTTLEALSQRPDRPETLLLDLGPITELGRFPPTPYPFVIMDGAPRQDPAALAEFARVEGQFQAEVRRRLALTPRKEVYIFVHGYNNSFADAAFTQAELWHFLGREGVPVLYTWPAGRGGLTGYAYDRESGEFTVFHLKQFLTSLMAVPEVESLHVLAHSRGTDVTLTALRELFIKTYAAGQNPRERYRIANLVLAAPDIDAQVLEQRVIAERVGQGVGQITIYVSRVDKAIGLAQRLFGSLHRLGQLTEPQVATEADLESVKAAAELENIHFVQMEGTTGTIGHSYFHSSPAASSDLILVLRYQHAPGADRPLEPAGSNFWIIEDEYPTAASMDPRPPGSDLETPKHEKRM